jgi:hypothetical protein
MKPELMVENLVHLRRAHRRHPGDADLCAVRADLERAAGPTLGRAASARLLGVSQTALDRWIAIGDVPVVLTPAGRHEVPVAALLDLIEAVERADDRRRPLASALRARRTGERRPRSQRPRASGHRAAEELGLAYHRVVAERLDDAHVADALVRLRRWRAEGRIHPRYADAWESLLTGPRDRLLTTLHADDEAAAALRQSSPFAGMLDERERRALLGLSDDQPAP